MARQTTGPRPRRYWLAVVYPIGVADVFGAGWDTDRLHRSRIAAEVEARQLVLSLGCSPIRWIELNDFWSIGRCHSLENPAVLYGVTVRGVLIAPPSPRNNRRS